MCFRFGEMKSNGAATNRRSVVMSRAAQKTVDDKGEKDVEEGEFSGRTTIELLFHYELLFIKLCAGFLFESKRAYLCILYRASIIVGTRFLAAKYYHTYTPEFEQLSKAASQNVRLFWTSYLIIAHTTVFVQLLTGIKYHRLILVILKKRFDKSYLQPAAADDASARQEIDVSRRGRRLVVENSETSPSPAVDQSRRRKHHDASASSIDEIGMKTQQRQRKLDGSRRLSANSQWMVQSEPPLRLYPSTSTSAASSSSLATTTTTTTAATTQAATKFTKISASDPWHAREEAEQTTALAKKKIRGRHVSRVTTVRYFLVVNLLLATLSSFLRNNAYTRPHNPPEDAAQQQLDKPRISGSALGLFANLSAAPPPVSAAFPRFTTAVMLNVPRSKKPLVTWLDQLVLTHSDGLMQTLAKLMFELIQASLNINQTHGHLFVVLMITATITEMLRFSCKYDGLVPHDEINERAIKYKLETKSNQRRRRPLLTTELLIQVRDVLILLRCTVSLDYLMLLIFDLSRLMNVFCMFTAALLTGKLEAILLLVIDYLSIAFSMSLTRLGYHWLHGEVRKLMRVVDEKNLLEKVTGDENCGNWDISQSERITTYRLAEHIDTLWPTDWFTPDLKSYLKNNIFVITFVATLQQLVEAGSKFEYQTHVDKAKYPK